MLRNYNSTSKWNHLIFKCKHCIKEIVLLRKWRFKWINLCLLFKCLGFGKRKGFGYFESKGSDCGLWNQQFCTAAAVQEEGSRGWGVGVGGARLVTLNSRGSLASKMKTFGRFCHYQLTSSVNVDHQSSSKKSFRVTQSTWGANMTSTTVKHDDWSSTIIFPRREKK